MTKPERTYKKMALLFAEILEYDGVERLDNWQGCPVFRPLKKCGKQLVKIPAFIIIRNGAAYSMPAEEKAQYALKFGFAA